MWFLIFYVVNYFFLNKLISLTQNTLFNTLKNKINVGNNAFKKTVFLTTVL